MSELSGGRSAPRNAGERRLREIIHRGFPQTVSNAIRTRAPWARALVFSLICRDRPGGSTVARCDGPTGMTSALERVAPLTGGPVAGLTPTVIIDRSDTVPGVRKMSLSSSPDRAAGLSGETASVSPSDSGSFDLETVIGQRPEPITASDLVYRRRRDIHTE